MTLPDSSGIDHLVTSGTFSLDGGTWDVDNNVWIVGDENEVVVIDAAHDADAIAAAVGGRTVVDPTCRGIGRDPEAHVRISRATGLHIVMGAGYYLQSSHPPEVAALSADDDARLGIEPLDEEMIQPSSIDVRLDQFFRVFNNSRYTHIDPKLPQEELTTLREVPWDEAFVLHPGEFVLASTLEKFTIPPHLAGRLEGKSSLGRLGLLTHATAGFVDPGFTGHVTLELSNVATLPIVLYPGMKIGQLCFFQLSSPADHPYGSDVRGSHYQGQRGPTASRSFRNFHRTPVLD